MCRCTTLWNIWHIFDLTVRGISKGYKGIYIPKSPHIVPQRDGTASAPRLQMGKWNLYPQNGILGTPLLAVTNGLVFCATLQQRGCVLVSRRCSGVCCGQQWSVGVTCSSGRVWLCLGSEECCSSSVSNSAVELPMAGWKCYTQT